MIQSTVRLAMHHTLRKRTIGAQTTMVPSFPPRVPMTQLCQAKRTTAMQHGALRSGAMSTHAIAMPVIL